MHVSRFDTVRQMIRSCIEQHVDEHELKVIAETEEAERSLLNQVMTFTRDNGTEALRETIAA